MNIEIYQIDTDVDFDGVCFRHYDELEDLQGTIDIDSSIYALHTVVSAAVLLCRQSTRRQITCPCSFCNGRICQ